MEHRCKPIQIPNNERLILALDNADPRETVQLSGHCLAMGTDATCDFGMRRSRSDASAPTDPGCQARQAQIKATLPRFPGAPGEARIFGSEFFRLRGCRCGIDDSLARKANDDLGPIAQPAFKLEGPVVQLGQS